MTGLLPYSRLTHYGATSRAVLPTRIAALHRSDFPEMLQRMPLLGQRLVSIMADRIRETTRIETQRDKLVALGKLSAGLAHELNNPAAAAQRATASLRETLETVRDASIRLARHTIPAEQRGDDYSLRTGGPACFEHLHGSPGTERSRRAHHHLARSASCAGRLEGRAGHRRRWSGDPQAGMPRRSGWGRGIIRCRYPHRIPAHNRQADQQRLKSAPKRISELVQAIKEYSYMDQAAMQEVDLNQELENTLTILNHKLKGTVTVVRGI